MQQHLRRPAEHLVGVSSAATLAERPAAACRPGVAASSSRDSRRRRRCSAPSRRGGWSASGSALQWGSRPCSTTIVPAGTSSGTRSSRRRRGSGCRSSCSNMVPSSSRRPARLNTWRSGPSVSAGRRPQAPVLERGVLDREPEPGDRHRVGVQERRVLVAADLAADPRLLEDVHALQRERVGQAEVGGDRGQLGV